MILVPKEDPVLLNLNSYYINFEKLIEHFQGDIEAGGIYLNASFAQGAVYFDEDKILNGVIIEKNKFSTGMGVLKSLKDLVKTNNFNLSIYNISPDSLFFWVNMPFGNDIYEEIISDKPDIEDIIEKISLKKLTGSLEISFQDKKQEGIIFFYNGTILSCSTTLESRILQHTKQIIHELNLENKFLQNTDQLLQELKKLTKKQTAYYNIKEISLESDLVSKKEKDSLEKPSDQIIEMFSSLLYILENIINKNKKIKFSFLMLLKREFVNQATTYSFLDPFTEEFIYADGKIQFTGSTNDKIFGNSVIASINNIVAEYNIKKTLKKETKQWSNKHNNIIVKYNFPIEN